MNKLLLIIIAISSLLASCQSPAPSTDQVDVSAIQTAAIQTAQASIVSIEPSQTATTEPTAIPSETPVPASGNVFSWNYIASQQSGGMTVEIARFLIGNKSEIPVDFTNGGSVTAFDDRPVIGEIIFKITNTTDKVINIYPDQGKVIAGGEQIDLFDFAIIGAFGDDFSGEIYPGVTVIGGIWFGFKRTAVDQIMSATIAFTGPRDNDFNSLGPDFNITLDLTTREFSPIPEELK